MGLGALVELRVGLPCSIWANPRCETGRLVGSCPWAFHLPSPVITTDARWFPGPTAGVLTRRLPTSSRTFLFSSFPAIALVRVSFFNSRARMFLRSLSYSLETCQIERSFWVFCITISCLVGILLFVFVVRFALSFAVTNSCLCQYI